MKQQMKVMAEWSVGCLQELVKAIRKKKIKASDPPPKLFTCLGLLAYVISLS